MLRLARHPGPEGAQARMPPSAAEEGRELREPAPQGAEGAAPAREVPAQGAGDARELDAQELWGAEAVEWAERVGGAPAVDWTEAAEDRLARLAGAVGPLRRVLAAIAERLVATEAYARLGYARPGDYARERAGLSARQLQELARVDRALAGLPALERALVANELPWSKVRLLARVAKAQDEGAWIARARSLPIRRLEAEVRASEPPRSELELPDEALPSRRVVVRCTSAVAEKWSLARELAERVAGQRLLAAQALEFVAAEVFSAISLDPAFVEVEAAPALSRAEAAEDVGAEAHAPVPRAPAPALPAAVAALAAGLAEADAFELDRRLRRAVRLEQTLEAAIAPLLRCVVSPEYEWRSHYQALPEYARERLGISVGKARALLRLERAGEVCPELREAYRRGRLSWVKAHCLLPLLLLDIEGEWRPVWVAWAQRVTVRRLEQDVERMLLLRASSLFSWQRCALDPERVQDPIPAAERQLCAREVDPEATQELVFRLPLGVAALYYSVSATLEARLQAARGRWPGESECFDALLDCALLAWTLRDPRARRHRDERVLERDGYRCAVPGCSSRRHLHRHHIRFRSAGGLDLAVNLITLCEFHHQRCVHAGLLRVRGSAPDGLVFELGVRPGAPPLERYRSGDVRAEPGEGAGPCALIGPPLDLEPRREGRVRARTSRAVECRDRPGRAQGRHRASSCG
jgi:hypothetical protein